MNKFASAVAAVGLVLAASSPAFASRAGGPDTQNPVAAQGAAVDQSQNIQVWAGDHREVQPVVTAESVTGAASDPSTIVHVGRLTYRVEKPAANGNADATALASSGRAVLVNG